MLRPQAFGGFFVRQPVVISSYCGFPTILETRIVGTCALGAALEAIGALSIQKPGQSIEDYFPILLDSSLAKQILYMNDKLQIPRGAIADWVEREEEWLRARLVVASGLEFMTSVTAKVYPRSSAPQAAG